MNASNVVYRFGRFELQPRERRLVRAGAPVSLPAKAFDLLVCLVGHAPRLVRKDELFAAVWPDTIVEETNLNYTVSLIRKALLDGRDGERCIETVPRQGYRFVLQVERIADLAASIRPGSDSDRSRVPLVQREPELEALRAALRRARTGQRQLVFVTGEAGIGKTSVVQTFLSEVSVTGGAVVARGQCIAHRGEAEAYMPVLEALGRLGRTADGRALVDALDRFAPSWLVQLPGLVSREQLPALQQRLLGQTGERMQREIDEALASATALMPLIVVLEDLHWSDQSTIDLLARLARCEDAAQLLILATYRPADALAVSHPLYAMVQELQLRGACQQLPLAPLSRPSVSAYVNESFAGAVPVAVVDLIHHRTEGSPLFIAALIESWRAGGMLVETNGRWSWHLAATEHALTVPESLRAFIEEQVRQLPRRDCDVLEAAAVAGADFSAAVVAGALERPLDDVEGACTRLARIGQFIRMTDEVEYPDGTVSDRYEFVHSFYVEVLYGLLPAGRRVRLHQQVALTLEALHGDGVSDVASQLAPHFVEARDARKAVKYLQLAAGQCLTRSAPREAITQLDQAQHMLRRFPDGDERLEHELSIQSMLATALTATRGFSDAGAEAAFRRAYELAKSLETPRLFPIAFGLATVLELRGQYRESQTLIEEHLPAQEACGGYVTEARDLLACSAYHQGAFEGALQHALKGLADERANQHSPLTGCFGEHPGIGCRTWAALSLWFLGRPDQALEYARRAVVLAEAPGHLYSLANARAQLACLHQLRRESQETERWAALTIELADRQGFAHRSAIGHVLHGWATGARGNAVGGLNELERGLEGARRIGMELDRPYFLALWAEILSAHGQFDRALAAIDEAQQRVSMQRSFFYDAELWRLRGGILLAVAGSRRAQEADECLARAVDTATRQGASILLLRAELARARNHRASKPSRAAAKAALGIVYASLSEGLDTLDLIETAEFLNSVDAASV